LKTIANQAYLKLEEFMVCTYKLFNYLFLFLVNGCFHCHLNFLNLAEG
jgi:hypothetical protein